MGFAADTLQDRVAVVTGASQGIGRAIAVELAKVGAHVVAVSRRRAAVEAVADAVRAQGRRALAVGCDVGDAGQVEDAVAHAVREFGRIDVLVNNAGYRIRSPLENLPIAEWDAMVRTNLTGVFLFSQTVGRVMIGQRSGRIINISSVAGRTGSRGMAAYAATKAAVNVLTTSLGAEWAKHGITVNAVAPGPVDAGHDRPGRPGGAAPAPRPARGDRVGGDLRGLRPGELHDRRDLVRERRPPFRQPRRLTGRCRSR